MNRPQLPCRQRERHLPRDPRRTAIWLSGEACASRTRLSAFAPGPPVSASHSTTDTLPTSTIRRPVTTRTRARCTTSSTKYVLAMLRVALAALLLVACLLAVILPQVKRRLRQFHAFKTIPGPPCPSSSFWAGKTSFSFPSPASSAQPN